jgi:hypothetical protein
MVSGDVTGKVLQAASFMEAQLRLEAEIKAESSIRSAMRSSGLRLDRSGKAKFRITGTVAQPNVR